MTSAGSHRAARFLPRAASTPANGGKNRRGSRRPTNTCVRSPNQSLAAPSPRGSPRRRCFARIVLLRTLLPDMPQGRAKKIQLQLLLTDLSLQFRDPLTRGGEIGRHRGSVGVGNATPNFGGR